MGIFPLSIYKKQRGIKNKGNTKFNAFFNGKSYFWGYFCDLRPSKMEKNEAEMQKQVPQNAVLVKKHNKMIGKKWILNMDFLRIWETGAYKNKIFSGEKRGVQ